MIRNPSGKKGLVQYSLFFLSFQFPSYIAPTGLSDEHFNMIGDRAFNPCMEIEMSALGCVEYYGAKRGMTICADHYDDLYECIHKDKQVQFLNFLLFYFLFFFTTLLNYLQPIIMT